MPITQNQINIDNSPWYIIMEKRALTWNEFAKNNNLNIEGFYNASIVTFKIESYKLKIIGERQVSNVSTLTDIGLEQISEEFNLSYLSSIGLKNNQVRIRKSSTWNFLRKKLKYKTVFKNYHITYNDVLILEKFKDIGVFNFEKMIKLIIDKKGVKITLLELPKETKLISSLLEFFKQLK